MAEDTFPNSSSIGSIYSATDMSSEETESVDEIPRSRSKNHVNYKEYDDEEFEEPERQKGSIEKILTHKKVDDVLQLYVKFYERPYRECTWVPSDAFMISKQSHQQLKRYLLKNENKPQSEPYFPQEYTIPKKILDHEKTDSGDMYLVLWKGLEYSDMTWETKDSLPNELIKQYKQLNKMPPPEYFEPPKKPNPSEWKKIKDLQKSKSGKITRSYQLDGLNFFVNSWYNNKNAILADEMGLGKTCQACVFLRYLFNQENIKGPFLILVPLSTITHWERELQDWTDCRILTYYGPRERRNAMKKYECFYKGTKVPKFNVLLTTYDYAIKDAKDFGTLTWQCIIVDEAHRLKNFDSKLTKTMKDYNANFKMLLTGTPLQNNTQELWSLLNFLDDVNFDSLNDFQEKFGELTEKDQIIQLQAILKPLMLRRLKGDVEKGLAPLEEVIIECGMTPHQRIYYQSIYKQNMEYLTRGKHRMAATNFNNIQMQLRKVCNHPYLIDGAEDQIIIERKEIRTETTNDHDFEMECLIKSSGKMILLDKLLAKLKKDGHRVLIFSQMTKMLTIIEDYLIYKGYKYERLDGNVRGNLRQESIDRYNAKDSEDFVFLLCTKAGGVGINLTSADTVIIYDSDWNPQNDLQATARCHRIGQTKAVKAYRFLTAKTYERKMFDTASVKLGLDHAVLESGKMNFSADEMEKMLRLGAYYAFEDDGDTEKFNEGDIESILSRSRTIRHENLVSGDGSTFSKVQFQVNEDELDVTDPEFWKKYMPIVEEEEAVAGGTIAQRRKMQREMNSMGTISKSTSIDLGDDVELNDEDIQMLDASNLTKGKLRAIHSAMQRYGWARWRAIAENAGGNTDVGEVKAICHCCLKAYIAASEEKDPILLSIYQQGANKETEDFEKKLMRFHKDVFEEIAANSAVKSNRITFLMFVNNIVGKCQNPPDELDFPEPRSNKPAEWWTKDDDKKLLYSVYKNGYGHYTEDITYTNPLDDVPKKLIATRIKSIVGNIREMFTKLKATGNNEMSLDKNLIQQLRAVWNKKEHRIVLNALSNFGYPDNKEKFVKFCNISTKDPENIIEYADMILKYCDEFDPENPVPSPPKIVEPMQPGQVKRIKFRTELFKKARDYLENNSHLLKDDEVVILEMFTEDGYPGVETNQKFRKMIEKWEDRDKIATEGGITKRVQMIIRGAEPRSGANTLHSYAVPKYEVDEDGNAILPCMLTPSLKLISMGKVVTDRINFHNERYLFPDGYTTERLYQSCVDLDDRAWYESKIIDTGDDYPLFQVTLKGTDVTFEGTAPSKPWLLLIKAIEDLKKENGLPGNRSMSISGPDCYGLTHPLVVHLMRDMPGAELCRKYQRPRETDDTEKDPALPPRRRERVKFSDSSVPSSKATSPFNSTTTSDNESTDDRENHKSESRKEAEEQHKPSKRDTPAPKRQIKKLELRINFKKLTDKEIEPRASIGSRALVQQGALSVPMNENSDPEVAVRDAVQYLANEYK